MPPATCDIWKMAWKRNEVIVERDDGEESSFSPRRSAPCWELQGRLPPDINLRRHTVWWSNVFTVQHSLSVQRSPAGRERSRLAKDTENGGNLTVNVSFARADEESLRISQSPATDGVILPGGLSNNWKSLEHNCQLDHGSTCFTFRFFAVRSIFKFLLFCRDTAAYCLHTPAANNL